MTQVYNASWLWARSQWRRSRTALWLCAIVVALTGSLALGAAAAAGRAASAMDRLREQTSATDLVLEGSVKSLSDESAAASLMDLYFLQLPGSDRQSFGDFRALTQRPLMGEPANVPILLEGRRSDPANPNEIEISPRFAERLDLEPGDQVSFGSLTDEYLAAFQDDPVDAGPPDGPVLNLLVTGIVLGPSDFSGAAGVVHLTPAFGDTYATAIAHFAFVLVRLADPSTADSVLAAGDINGAAVQPDQFFSGGDADGGLRVVTLGLWLFAAAVTVAGSSVFALLARRLGRSFRADAVSMTALGLDRRGLAGSGLLLFVPAIAVGLSAALVSAPFVAARLRLGLAGTVEPARGVHVDLAVMLIGGLALGALSIAAAATSMPTARRDSVSARSWRSEVIPIRRPLALTIGIRDALATGDQQVPSRAMLAMSSTVTATAVACILFGVSVDALGDTPQAWGAAGDVTVNFGISAGEPGEVYELGMQELSNDDRVQDLNGMIGFESTIDGPPVNGVVIDVRRGNPILTVLAGRLPRTDDEVVLGRATMRALDRRLGDEVAITVGGASQTFDVVGQVAFPTLTQSFDSGAAVTVGGGRRFERLDMEWLVYRSLITWKDGVDQGAAADDLRRAGFAVIDDQPVPSTWRRQPRSDRRAADGSRRLLRPVGALGGRLRGEPRVSAPAGTAPPFWLPSDSTRGAVAAWSGISRSRSGSSP